MAENVRRIPVGGYQDANGNSVVTHYQEVPSPPTAWIVVKQWPGGKIEPVAGYTDEQKARHAAGQLIGREECWIVLWTVEMRDE